MDNVERFPIQCVTEEGKRDTEDIVTKELPLTIIVNNEELVTMLCSPSDLDSLAIGFLFSEGLLKNKDEIKKITVDVQRGVVRVQTKPDSKLAGELSFKPLIASGGGKGASFQRVIDAQGQAKVKSQATISAQEVFALVGEFVQRSRVF